MSTKIFYNKHAFKASCSVDSFNKLKYRHNTQQTNIEEIPGTRENNLFSVFT